MQQQRTSNIVAQCFLKLNMASSDPFFNSEANEVVIDYFTELILSWRGGSQRNEEIDIEQHTLFRLLFEIMNAYVAHDLVVA